MLFEVPRFCFFFFFFRALVKGVATLLWQKGFCEEMLLYLCSNLLKYKAGVVYFACLSIGLFSAED